MPSCFPPSSFLPPRASHANWTGYTDTMESKVSTDPPLAVGEVGALPFSDWRLLGTEFAVVSNINSWIVCQPDVGDLLNLVPGTVSCQNVMDSARAATYGCSGKVPTRFTLCVALQCQSDGGSSYLRDVVFCAADAAAAAAAVFVVVVVVVVVVEEEAVLVVVVAIRMAVVIAVTGGGG